MKRILLFLLLGLSLTSSSWAQIIQLGGTVTDSSGSPINAFTIQYFAYDSLSGLVDSGMMVTNATGQYGGIITAAPLPSTYVQLFYQDCNIFSTVVLQGQVPPIVYDIVSCPQQGFPGNCLAAFSTTTFLGNPLAVIFNAVLPSTATFSWDFGDGNTGSGPNTPHTYAAAGTYTVCLVVDDGMGCVDSSCVPIVVGQNPPTGCDPTFTASQISGSNSAVFMPYNYDPNNYYEWHFGDGNFSTIPIYTHTYAQPDTYLVCLLVVSSTCTDTLCQPVVITGPGGNPCQASFLASSSSGGTYQFTNQSIGANPTGVNYYWDFGDGTIDSTSVNPTHTYAQNGYYTVCLTMATGACVSVFCDSVNVVGSTGCTAFFGWSPTGTNPFDIGFYWSGSGNGGTSKFWDFGDGTTDTVNFPIHTYSTAGSYLVCLTITDATGCTATFCDSVQAGPITPTCSAQFFAFPDSSGSALSYDFFSQGQPGVNYQWDFGDGSFGSGPYANYSYAQPGTYVVCLSATFQNCTDTICQIITVFGNNQPCNADFVTNLTPNNVISFSALYPAQSYFWDLGDGTTATGSTVTHNYTAAGTYTVCLVVSDSACTDTVCQMITTSPITPPPGFAVFGQVWAGNQVADDFTAWLVVYDSAAGTLAAVDTFVSDTSNYGFFFFTAPNGDYRVKASLNSASSVFSSYMPTYYGDELFWNNAIVVNQNSYPLMTINLITGNNPGGPGFIGGLVSQGANKDEGDPLSGMQLIVTDVNGDAVAHATTDQNGEYEFPSLPYGTYHVYVEMWGRDLGHHTVTLSPNAPGAPALNFEVTEKEVIASGTTGIEDLIRLGEMRLYPNPASQLLNLEMDLKQAGEVQLALQSLMGQTVLQQVERRTDGYQSLEMNVSGLSNGIYLLQVSIEGQALAPLKVVIQR